MMKKSNTAGVNALGLVPERAASALRVMQVLAAALLALGLIAPAASAEPVLVPGGGQTFNSNCAPPTPDPDLLFYLEDTSGLATVNITGINSGGTVNADADLAIIGGGNGSVSVDTTGFSSKKEILNNGNPSKVFTAVGSTSPRQLIFDKTPNANRDLITVSCGDSGGGASLILDKSANRTTYSAAGDKIVYTYTVTNQTGENLNPVTISDDKINGGASFNCGTGSLANNAVRVCTAEYTVQPGDVQLPSDSVTNTATATGKKGNQNFVSSPDSVTVTFSPPPDDQADISLSKEGDASTWSGLPKSIKYTYTVRNTGDVALTNIQISDDRINGGTQFSCGEGTLAVDAVRTCEATYVATESDVGKDIENEATASGQILNAVSAQPGVISDPSTWTVRWEEPQAALTLSKEGDASTWNGLPKSIKYTYTVRNTGDVPLTNIRITDDRIDSGMTFSCGAGTLAVDAERSCEATYVATESDLGKDIENEATASGDTLHAEPTTVDSDPATWTVVWDGPDHDDEVKREFESLSYNFIAQRLNLIATNGPRLAWLVNRLEGGFGGNALNVVSENGDVSGSFAFGTSSTRQAVSGERVMPTADAPRSEGGINAWIEGQFALYADDREDEDAEGDFFIGYAGVDLAVMDRVNIGIMGEIDWMNEEGDDDADVDGTGWMIGPYLSAEIAHGVFLDLRAMGGTTDNSISQSVLGVDYDGDFQTTRWLAEATVSGDYVMDSVTLTPDLRFLYVRENQDDYTVRSAFNEVDVDGKEVVLAQLSSGLRLSHLVETDTMLFRPYVAGRLFWNIDNPGELTVAGEYVSTDDVRGAVTVGLDGGSGRTQFGIEGTYDGLFSDDDHAISGRLSFGMTF